MPTSTTDLVAGPRARAIIEATGATQRGRGGGDGGDPDVWDAGCRKGCPCSDFLASAKTELMFPRPWAPKRYHSPKRVYVANDSDGLEAASRTQCEGGIIVGFNKADERSGTSLDADCIRNVRISALLAPIFR